MPPLTVILPLSVASFTVPPATPLAVEKVATEPGLGEATAAAVGRGIRVARGRRIVCFWGSGQPSPAVAVRRALPPSPGCLPPPAGGPGDPAVAALRAAARGDAAEELRGFV